MSFRLSALLVLALGCAPNVPAPPARAPVHSPVLAHGVPARVFWEELVREPGRLEARVRVLRSGDWLLPLRVRIEVPEGVVTLGGRTAFEVGPDVHEHVEDLRFSTGDGPTRPLVAYLDGLSEGAGLHGEARLPELPEPTPVPRGRVLRFGGAILGEVVPETPGPSTPARPDSPTGLQ